MDKKRKPKCLVVEAALKSDKIVISMDETVRDCFHEIIQNIGTLKQIAWVNPCKDEETPIEWLKSGAALDRNVYLAIVEKIIRFKTR